MSQPHPIIPSITERLANSAISPMLWTELDVLYAFTTYNLLRRPFMMVRGVKKAERFSAPADFVYL